MKRITITLIVVLLFVCSAKAQLKSMTGIVVDIERGTYKWEAIVVQVGDKRYLVYTFSGNHPSPTIVGRVGEVGRTVQIFYTTVQNGEYDGGIFATKIIEVKKSNTPSNQRASDTCGFCGVWKYSDRESQSTNYLKIILVGAGKFRLIPGYEGVRGRIALHDSEASGLGISKTDGIYLRPVNGNLVGSFASINFRPTGGDERTYRITCELKPNSKMAYTVASSGSNERYVATKTN